MYLGLVMWLLRCIHRSDYMAILNNINITKTTLTSRKEGAVGLLRNDDPLAYDANAIRLSATDVLAPTTMKNAAKCDT